jgi:hypothetical protein
MDCQSKLARDQVFHDLVGATIDALDARVSVQACNRVLDHVAIAAKQLQTLVSHLALRSGSTKLSSEISGNSGDSRLDWSGQANKGRFVFDAICDGRKPSTGVGVVK